MSILEQFPTPSLYDGRSVAEIDAKIEEGISEVIVNDGDITYPNIGIDPSRIIKPSLANTRRSDAFMINQRSVLGTFWSSCRSKGLVSGLNVLISYGETCPDDRKVLKTLMSVMVKISLMIIFIYHQFSDFKNRIFPFNSLSKDELVAEFSECADWTSGVIKAFKWHPKLTRCALALINDDVYVYSSSPSSVLNDGVVPLLRHALQKKITDLAFHPSASGILAVGTASNVIIWNISSETKVSRVSLSCARVIDAQYYQTLASDAFKRIDFMSASFSTIWPQVAEYMKTPTMIKTPITSISFNSVGNILASSPSDSRILIIDVKKVIASFPDSKSISTDAQLTNIDKKKHEDALISNNFDSFRQGVAKLILSRDGKRLLASPSANFVRVYETLKYSYRDWSLSSSSALNLWTLSYPSRDAVQSAVWSNNGRFLLLAFKNDPSVWTLTFLDNPEPYSVGGSPRLVKILDLSEYELPNGQIVGGNVQTMAWDANSERLVISFKDNPFFLAAFKTLIRPTLHVIPIGYLHGIDGERPLIIAFHDAFGRQNLDANKSSHNNLSIAKDKNFGISRKGSLLTIVWSSGVVSNIPFQYIPSSMERQINNVTSPAASIRSSTPRSLTKICTTSPNVSKFPLSPITSQNASASFRAASFLSSDSIISPRKPTLFTASFKENM